MRQSAAGPPEGGRYAVLDYAAAGDFVVPFQDDFYGLGVDAMFPLSGWRAEKGVLVVGNRGRGRRLAG